VTPKQIFDTEGVPFPCTRLDEFSGVEHQQDAYRTVEEDEQVDKLPDSVFGNVKAIDVVDDETEPLPAKIRRHGTSHASQPDEADRHRCAPRAIVAQICMGDFLER